MVDSDNRPDTTAPEAPEVLDAEPRPKRARRAKAARAPAAEISPVETGATSSSRALVPFTPPKTPALVGQLGDLEAFMRAADRAPMLSADEEHDLAVRLRDKNDLEAAQQLILSHLRLVISIARGFLGYGLPYADLIQEGNIGLMKAIRHYDPDRGARLMTFAVHWIRS